MVPNNCLVPIIFQNIFLCVQQKKETRGWVNDDRIFIFGWSLPLMKENQPYHDCCYRFSKNWPVGKQNRQCQMTYITPFFSLHLVVLAITWFLCVDIPYIRVLRYSIFLLPVCHLQTPLWPLHTSIFPPCILSLYCQAPQPQNPNCFSTVYGR